MSVKDSELPNIKDIDETTSFAVVHDDNGIARNKKISIDKLSEYLTKNIDITKIPVSGYDSLSAALSYLKSLIKAIGEGYYIPEGLTAEDIKYSVKIGDRTPENVHQALGYITNIIYNGIIPLLAFADDSEIQNIIETTII